MQSNIVVSVLLAALISAGAARADRLNLKVGAWEQTIVTTTAGTLIPASVLAKMPPDRQQAMAKVAAARAKKPSTFVSKTCFTKEDIDEDRILKDDDSDEGKCITKIISKTSTSLVVEKSCSSPARKMRGSFTAPTPQTMRGVIDILGERVGEKVSEQAGEQGKVHVDMKGHWIGADCAAIEDRD